MIAGLMVIHYKGNRLLHTTKNSETTVPTIHGMMSALFVHIMIDKLCKMGEKTHPSDRMGYLISKCEKMVHFLLWFLLLWWSYYNLIFLEIRSVILHIAKLEKSIKIRKKCYTRHLWHFTRLEEQNTDVTARDLCTFTITATWR